MDPKWCIASYYICSPKWRHTCQTTLKGVYINYHDAKYDTLNQGFSKYGPSIWPARLCCFCSISIFVYILVLILPYVLALSGFTGFLSGPSREKFENPCPKLLNQSKAALHVYGRCARKMQDTGVLTFLKQIFKIIDSLVHFLQIR